MSWMGIPSVRQTMRRTPASAASSMASGAADSGTMIMLQSAPVASTATLTESKTGTLPSSTHSPPLPGRTPPTTWVPYSSMRSEWKRPSRPVMPCTTTRVFLFAKIPILFDSFCGLHGLLGRCGQGLGRDHVGLRQQGAAFLGVGAHQADDHWRLRLDVFQGFQ